VFVSAATVWEISIKRALGKLEVPGDLVDQIEANRMAPLSITISHAYAAGVLPPHHEDPFDRILVAQALAEDLTIATRDPRISMYDVPVLQA
jgi:PIN domain nuclease of toxin-antitoxin system